MSVLDELTSDLDWRETEIASIRILLSDKNVSESQHLALLRAAWALLYAHYEGFCKLTLTSYFDEICNRGIKNSSLPKSIRVFALSEKLKKLRNLQNIELLSELEAFIPIYLDCVPEFPEIDTQSNLWPGVLTEILESADLSTRVVKQHSAKLKTLVARRNGIAHGEQSFIAEVEYYNSFEKAVYDVIYDLVFQVDEKLNKAPFV